MSSPTSVVVDKDDKIRGRLLSRLGIYEAPVDLHSQPLTAAEHRRQRILRGMGLTSPMRPSYPDGSAPRNPLKGMKITTEKLKVDGIHPKKTVIQFSEDVEILPIPTRYEYSDRIKSQIWSNRHELQENAERNAVEFASEGWNWRNVTEDDGMYICSQSGELVHPIHLQHLMEEQQQQKAAVGLQRGDPVHREQ